MPYKVISVALTANSSGLVTGLARAGVGVKQFEQQVDKSGKATQEAGKMFTLARVGALGLAAGVAYAVKSATDFQSKMLEVKAVSGANAGQMTQLSAKALQLGQDTVFSASQAADAIGELVKAGVSVGDVMHGAADATVALAAAGGISLPEAATIAANALNAFELKAKDLPHVADLIAGAANASAIDVGEFAQSFQQVSAVAHLAGVSLEDITTAIAELGNAGIKGSDAGTSLKTMLQYLQPQSKQAAAEMEKLGIITATGGNRFYDAAGNAKGLASIAEVLKQSLDGLTKQQQQQALATLFGTDAIRAASVLANGGAASFDKLSDSIGKVKAADVAKTRMSGLSGAVQNLSGSVETAAIQLGTKLLPALTTTANFAASTMVPAFSSLADLLIKHGDLVVTAAVAYAAWKFVPPLLASVSAGYETLALKAMYATDAVRSLGKGSFLTGLTIGTVGAAGGFVILDNAIKGLSENLHSAKLNAEALKASTAGYDKITSGLDLTDPAKFKAAQQAIEGFAQADREAGAGIRQFALDIAQRDPQMAKLAQRFETTQAQLSILSGLFGISKDAVAGYSRTLGIDLGGNFDKVRKQLSDYINTQVAGTPSTRAAAQAVLDEAGGAETAAQKIDDLTKSIDTLMGANQTLLGDELDVNKAILTLGDSIDQASRHLDQNSLAGITNEQAILSVAKAIKTQTDDLVAQGVPYDQVKIKIYAHATALENAAVKAGFNRDQVRFLIQTILQMPPEKHTNVSTPGTKQATTDVQVLDFWLHALQDVKRVTFLSNGVPDVVGDISRINAALDKIGGSYVVSVGGTGRKLINAEGGYYPENHQAMIGNGITRVWNEPETGGEAYIPLSPAKRGRSLSIWAKTGQALGAFANGGFYDTTVSVDTQDIGGTLVPRINDLLAEATAVGSVGGSVARWMPIVLRALALNGASASWAPRVLAQIQFESGGDPNIHQSVIDINTFNGSGGAQGLMQVLYSTFMSNHIPGTSMSIFDPLANVAAGIHHAIHEDPGGLAYLGQGHGYATGGVGTGWARVGERGPENVYLGRGARIFPADETRRMASVGGGITLAPTISISYAGTGADSPEVRAAIRQGVQEGLAETVKLIDQGVGGKR